MFGLVILSIFVLIALFAPFLASSMPMYVCYDNESYFPLFRYLVSTSYFTKRIDIFFNLLGILFFPFLATFLIKGKMRFMLQGILLAGLISAFVFFGFYYVADPAISRELNMLKQEAFLELTRGQDDPFEPRVREELPSWAFDLMYMNHYAKLNLLLHQKNLEFQEAAVLAALTEGKNIVRPYTLLQIQKEQEDETVAGLKKALQKGRKSYVHSMVEERKIRNEIVKMPSLLTKMEPRLRQIEEDNGAYEELENRLQYIFDRRAWIEQEKQKISHIVMPLIRNFHWEEDAGGEQALNLSLPFYEQTRTTRKDLMSALIFGSRISLFVGFVATLLAMALGVFLGLLSGYYGAWLDMALCRFVEVWESMPAFFMLLFIVTILETKSIFVIIATIALFGWTQSFRFVRAETFRQRELAYVDASKALGFSDSRILFYHILPNALLAVLALLPFDIMSAITREAGLAFLGLGEEQSCSWGVLMDEGRSAFPAESSLLWPPAIVLTTLLIAIAFVGEALQWAMNPKESR